MAIAHPILGAWRLRDWTVSAGGRESRPFGESPQGRLLYTPDGQMLAAIARAGRPPLSTAVAQPLTESTVATSVSRLVNSASAPFTVLPSASVIDAVSCTDCPAASESSCGLTASAVAVCSIRTVAVSAALSADASICTVPVSTAVTSPALSTVATSVSRLVQVGSAPSTAFPLASVTAAASRVVSPSAVSVSALGLTTTLTATCVTVMGRLSVDAPDVART